MSAIVRPKSAMVRPQSAINTGSKRPQSAVATHATRPKSAVVTGSRPQSTVRPISAVKTAADGMAVPNIGLRRRDQVTFRANVACITARPQPRYRDQSPQHNIKRPMSACSGTGGRQPLLAPKGLSPRRNASAFAYDFCSF